MHKELKTEVFFSFLKTRSKLSEVFLREHNCMLLTISKVINISFVLSVTTLLSEKGFGAQSQIKSKFRN